MTAKQSRPIPRVLGAVLFGLLLFGEAALAGGADVDYDTTRVRDVKRTGKSFTQRVADIPGEALKLPVYALEGALHIVTLSPPSRNAVSFLSERRGKSKLVPVLGYSSRAGLKLGLKLKPITRRDPEERMRIKAYYSTNNYQLYRFRFSAGDLFSPGAGLGIETQYRKETRRSFYGFGNASARANEANFTLESTKLNARFTKKIRGSFSIEPSVGYEAMNLFDGENPSLLGSLRSIELAPALNVRAGQLESVRILSASVTIRYEALDNVARPTSGRILMGSAQRITGLGRSDGDDYNYWDVEFRNYLNVWRRRVIAFRAFFRRIDRREGPKYTPLALANRLGGEESLRGYTRGRFVDNDAALVSLEYRYPIYDVADAFVFLDGGRVFSDVSETRVFTNWHGSYGFGLRIASSRKFLAIAQIAASEESTRLYFDLEAIW